MFIPLILVQGNLHRGGVLWHHYHREIEPFHMVLDPAVGDVISVAVGATTSTTAPTSLSQCAYSGSQAASKTVASATTALDFAPSVNIAANGPYYGWVFLYVNNILVGVYGPSTSVVIGTITVTIGSWA